MAKIIKNTTISIIELKEVGVSVPASGQYVINPNEYPLWTTVDSITEITPFINSGDLVVNDGVLDIIAANGLSLDRAIDFIKYPDTAFNSRFLSVPERTNGFVSKNVQEAIEEARSAIEGKIAVLPTFLNNGLTNNKWLQLDGSIGSSDNLPAITTYDSKLAGLSYINTNNNSNVDIEFYINGAAPGNLVYTWQIRTKRHAYKTNDLNAVVFTRGDRISCFARAVTGTSARDVIVNIFVQSTNSLVGEGGGAVGIS